MDSNWMFGGLAARTGVLLSRPWIIELSMFPIRAEFSYLYNTYPSYIKSTMAFLRTSLSKTVHVLGEK